MSTIENQRRIFTGLISGMSLGLFLQQTGANILHCIEFLLLSATAFLGIPGILIYIPMVTLCAILFMYISKFVLTLKTGFGQVGAGMITGLAAGYGLACIIVDLVNVFGGLL